jgi:nucleotide-binding universal stress UspA family protein
MLGSVTEKLLRRTPCPMLTVPSGVVRAPARPIPFSRIVCAVDFSPSSLKALEYAESLAEEMNAELRVVHVLEAVSSFDSVAMGVSGAPLVNPHHAEAAWARLRGAISKGARISRQVTETVTVDKAYREILREAADNIGAHGGLLGSTGFGSTTDHVIREAICPVLSLRA